MTFRHSGKIGDIIFSLPTIKYFGGGVLYLPESSWEQPRILSNMKELLLQQDYIEDVREYPSFLAYGEKCNGIHIDIDLDRHREHEKRGWQNMVLRYFDIFGITGVDHTEPWLTIKGPRLIDHDYNLINLTERFRKGSPVNWKKVYDKIEKPCYFIGTEKEHKDFCKNYGYILKLDTPDFLTFAIYIRDCTALYCNQSAALSIAQSIRKTYHCQFKPSKQNCKFFTPNEFELI